MTMAKKVLVISSSLRSRSNSEALADEFIKGALSAGNGVEKITLKDKNIRFCKGCLACQTTFRCAIEDDMAEILPKVQAADVICFATPIYYYEMSGQLKTFLDRCNPLYPTDYKFRDVYVLTTAAEDEESTPQRAVSGICGWIDCFENARLAGSVFAGGVNDMGEIEGHKSLEGARKMGAEC